MRGEFSCQISISTVWITSFVVAKGANVEKGLVAILEETERARKFGFTASELARAKTQYMVSQEKSFKEKDKTNSEQIAGGLVGAFIDDENLTSPDFSFDFYKNSTST